MRPPRSSACAASTSTVVLGEGDEDEAVGGAVEVLIRVAGSPPVQAARAGATAVATATAIPRRIVVRRGPLMARFPFSRRLSYLP